MEEREEGEEEKKLKSARIWRVKTTAFHNKHVTGRLSLVSQAYSIR